MSIKLQIKNVDLLSTKINSKTSTNLLIEIKLKTAKMLMWVRYTHQSKLIFQIIGAQFTVERFSFQCNSST